MKTLKKPTLAERIEKIQEQPWGERPVPPHIAQFLENFLQRYQEVEPLPEIDLMSPESARAAAAMLAQKQEELQQLIKNASALKALLK